MDTAVARALAHAGHRDQRDTDGRLRSEHVERVAAAVPPEACAVAFLHDLLEWSDTTVEELRARGLTDVEATALDLLTRTDAESYELYILRIAHASGLAGRLARAVKLADLDEHLRQIRGTHISGRPPYAWGREHIAVAQERKGEVAFAPGPPAA